MSAVFSTFVSAWPKTAGKSVQKFFGKNWHNHKDISRYAQQLEPRVFASYYKFTIVRNPWDRMSSDYNFQKKKDTPDNHKLFTHDERGPMEAFPNG
ncbi:MAG TPA: sulfotransferase family 2 domain-containing protein [Candidatus Acidoferrum sp.]|nr:sulfotransferase family 2 domain-containing protein [Candidatus Acidoferrum sp.]